MAGDRRRLLFLFFSPFLGRRVDDTTTAVRFLLGGIMLAGAVVYDLRDRRVPNPWWIPFAWLAGILVIGDLWRGDHDATLLAVRYGMSLVLAAVVYLLWRFHLFGGADAKGLMLLAVLAPWPPSTTYALQPALDALANGALLMLLLPVGFLLANLARGRFVLPAALLGTPRPLALARQRFVWPMQVADPAAPGGLRWRYWQRLGGDLPQEYHRLEQAGLQEVWVTPKVPFLVPVALGWAIAWWHGNLLLQAMAALQ